IFRFGHPASFHPCSRINGSADISPRRLLPHNHCLAAGESWPTLTVTAVAPRPSHRAISAALTSSLAPRPSCKVTPTTVVATPTSGIRPPCKATIFVVPTTTPAPRPSYKSISAPVVATTTPQHHQASFAAIIATPTPASRPLQKVVITIAASASRSAHKTSSMVFLYSSRMTCTQSQLRKAKRRIRKFSPVSWRTTWLNRQEAQPLPPGHRYGASRSGSLRRRRASMTTLKKKVTVAPKREDLPPGWCYPSRRHSTYPRLVADY
ncbi:hypothetical protein ACLOJK_029337, partial [Asimina triloba]